MKWLLSLNLLFCITAKSSIVDTVDIYSRAMNKSRKCVVILPFQVNQKPIPVPVVYLLHGYGGSYDNWINKVPAIREYADRYQVMLVCPDGESSSWYLNSPVDRKMQYDTYIGEEVPAYIDSQYLTIKNRAARVITGLSMGGYGAISIAVNHSKFFGGCGSMSGAVDLSSIKTKYDLIKRLGDTVVNSQSWKLLNLVGHVPASLHDSLRIIVDCGIDDPFITDNRRLHQEWLNKKLPHDYIERPGKHDWVYWGQAIEYQLLYFRRFFDEGVRKAAGR